MLLTNRKNKEEINLTAEEILKLYFSKNKEKDSVKRYELFRFCFSHKGLDSDFTDEDFDQTFKKLTYEKKPLEEVSVFKKKVEETKK